MKLKDEVLGHTVVRVLNALHELKPQSPIRYVETGTIRDALPFPGDPYDARSTLAVARWLRQHRLPLNQAYSIDNYQTHLDIAKKVLADEGLEDTFTFMLGDGAEVLVRLAGNFDVVLLDSDSNSGVTAREYKSIQDRVKKPGFVLIDDIGRNGVDKGAFVLAERDKQKLPWKRIAPYVACIPFGAAAEKLMLSL